MRSPGPAESVSLEDCTDAVQKGWRRRGRAVCKHGPESFTTATVLTPVLTYVKCGAGRGAEEPEVTQTAWSRMEVTGVPRGGQLN